MSIRNRLDAFFTPRFAKKSQLLERSKVFCISPWIQLHAQTNGKVGPCCMASLTDGNEVGDLRENPNLIDAWNSDKMKKLRSNMLNERKTDICGNCYRYEDLGKFSERMQYNQDFRHYYSRVTDTLRDGTVPANDVPIIDIRFSNKCNYKCRICNSDYSTLWYDEEMKLGKIVPGQPKEINAATEEEAFWNSYLKLLPYVKRLHFAGGEPLFMDEHYKALEHLISIGKTDVNLTYNTNLSTLRYKRYNVIDFWKQFKKVDIWASLDGMGARGDYQRKGQKWKEIEDNIRTIQQECPHIDFGVNVTVSLLNIMHVPDFFRHLVENKFVDAARVNLYPLFYPHHFAVTNLSPDLKRQAIEKFEAFDKEYLSTLSGSAKIRDHIKAMITLMQSGKQDKARELKQAIESVDHLRDEDFAATFPELASLVLPTVPV